jgi:hypothetical protein
MSTPLSVQQTAIGRIRSYCQALAGFSPATASDGKLDLKLCWNDCRMLKLRLPKPFAGAPLLRPGADQSPS